MSFYVWCFNRTLSINITKLEVFFFVFLFSQKIHFPTLEKDVSEKMDKLTATLDKERQTYQETMAWANKHCSQMDQKIKQLESQLLKSQLEILNSVEKDEIRHQKLLKSQPVILDSVEQDEICIKEEKIIKDEIEPISVVKLRIKKLKL